MFKVNLPAFSFIITSSWWLTQNYTSGRTSSLANGTSESGFNFANKHKNGDCEKKKLHSYFLKRFFDCFCKVNEQKFLQST